MDQVTAKMPQAIINVAVKDRAIAATRLVITKTVVNS
jgi:hypothetical protein